MCAASLSASVQLCLPWWSAGCDACAHAIHIQMCTCPLAHHKHTCTRKCLRAFTPTNKHTCSRAHAHIHTLRMDQTTKNLLASPSGVSALILAEAQKLPGGCGGKDAEDPTCAKVTILGNTRAVPPEEVDEAMNMLLARHPSMGEQQAAYGFDRGHEGSMDALCYWRSPGCWQRHVAAGLVKHVPCTRSTKQPKGYPAQATKQPVYCHPPDL